MDSESKKNFVEMAHNSVPLKIVDGGILSDEEKAARRKNINLRMEKAREVCARYSKGDQFDFSLIKNGNTYRVILDDAEVGVFAIRDSGSTKQISTIMLNESLRKKGFGKQLYTKLNSYFHSLDGSVLATDNMKTSEAADNLWQSLVKDGLAEETNQETADGHKIYRFKK